MLFARKNLPLLKQVVAQSQHPELLFDGGCSLLGVLSLTEAA
jgi:hypothetical protein